MLAVPAVSKLFVPLLKVKRVRVPELREEQYARSRLQDNISCVKLEGVKERLVGVKARTQAEMRRKRTPVWKQFISVIILSLLRYA